MSLSCSNPVHCSLQGLNQWLSRTLDKISGSGDSEDKKSPLPPMFNNDDLQNCVARCRSAADMLFMAHHELAMTGSDQAQLCYDLCSEYGYDSGATIGAYFALIINKLRSIGSDNRMVDWDPDDFIPRSILLGLSQSYQVHQSHQTYQENMHCMGAALLPNGVPARVKDPCSTQAIQLSPILLLPVAGAAAAILGSLTLPAMGFAGILELVKSG